MRSRLTSSLDYNILDADALQNLARIEEDIVGVLSNRIWEEVIDVCPSLNSETATALRSRVTDIVRTCTETAFHNVAGLPRTSPYRAVTVEPSIPTAATVADQPQVSTVTIPVVAQPWTPPLSRNPFHRAILNSNPFRPETAVQWRPETSIWRSFPSTENDWYFPAIAGTVTNPFASSASPTSPRATSLRPQEVSQRVEDTDSVGHIGGTNQHNVDIPTALQSGQSPVASP